VLHADVFGTPGFITAARRMLDDAGVATAETALLLPSGKSGGIQLGTLPGIHTEPVWHDGRMIGHVFEDEDARYCLLGGLLPGVLPATPEAQADEVLRIMRDALEGVGMQFQDVVRTWFYNDRILDWYDGFNRARTAFFRQQNLRMMPASTGIGAPNPAGAALVAKLLAVRPKSPAVTVRAVESPLQCSAFDYGSAFSRAVEVASPGARALFVSGTASIEPGGKTIHCGDTALQVETTMEVVDALLAAAGMAISDTTRGIAYFRHADDLPLWRAWCESRGLTALPVLPVESTICRDDLLFEIELDAARVV
jgi:enamine deaminase RidA (YjgF/YER057c/UK114 family)